MAGQTLGIPDFIPAYMAPETHGPAILNGVNYASGAAGILNSSGYLFVRLSRFVVQSKLLNVNYPMWCGEVDRHGVANDIVCCDDESCVCCRLNEFR